MLDFQNNTLHVDDLPHFENIEGQSIALSYIKVLRINYLFWLTLVLSGLVLLYFFANPPLPLFFILVTFLMLIFTLIIIEIEKGYSRRKYGIREKDIIFQKGFFVFKETIVPYKRIQHVELRQSLIFKAFKIFTLKIYTAGSSTGDLSIRGLTHETADKIKAQILKVADLDED